MLFSLSKGGKYFLAGLAKLFEGVLGLLLEVQSLAGKHDVIDFHLVGGRVAARGCFSHYRLVIWNYNNTDHYFIFSSNGL